MHYATTSGMILAAMAIGEVVAGPAHVHLHQHQRAHKEKRGDVDWTALDWDNMGIDWTSAWAAGQAKTTSTTTIKTTTTPAAITTTKAITTTAAVVPTTTAKAAATTTKAESPAESLVDEVASLWNDVVGLANHLTVFGEATSSSGEVVDKIGNIGNIQGSNMIKVSSRAGYDFTNEFINTSGSSITVMLWNKAFSNTGHAADAEANLGSCVAPKTPALSIALGPGQSQIVAFQADTQMGFAQATSDIAASGAFATTWGEVNFMPSGSGYDVSAIMNIHGNNYNMSISSAESSCVSDMTQNFWLTDSQPIGGSDGSCYIAQSTATLTTLMGGTV